LLVIGLILSCVAFDVVNGTYYCGEFDLQHHISPCRQVLSIPGPRYHIYQVIFSPDSRRLAVTTSEHITIWDVASGALIYRLPFVLTNTPRWSSFSPDGARLATTGEVGVQVVDLASQQVLYTISGVDQRGGVVSFSPDGRLLAHSERLPELIDQQEIGHIRLFDAHDGTLLQTIPGRFALDGYSLSFTPDSSHLVFLADGKTRVWNIKAQQISSEVPNYSIMSPDATYLFTPEIRLNTTVMTLGPTYDRYVAHQEVENHCTGGKAIAFLPHSDRVVAVTNTQHDEFIPSVYPTMCVWRMGDGKMLWQARAQGDCVAVAPNGNVAAVCNGSGIQIWQVPPEWYQ
jgi:WD40 repeat protein